MCLETILWIAFTQTLKTFDAAQVETHSDHKHHICDPGPQNQS